MEVMAMREWLLWWLWSWSSQSLDLLKLCLRVEKAFFSTYFPQVQRIPPVTFRSEMEPWRYAIDAKRSGRVWSRLMSAVKSDLSNLSDDDRDVKHIRQRTMVEDRLFAIMVNNGQEFNYEIDFQMWSFASFLLYFELGGNGELGKGWWTTSRH